MRKTYIIMIAVFLSLFMATPVFAHGFEAGRSVSAAAYVKRAIVFLEGIHSVDQATTNIQNALKAKGASDLDQSKLNQALTELKNKNIEQAKASLAQALGDDPKNAVELTFRPHYSSSSTNVVLLGIAAISLILGSAVIRKVKVNS